MTGGEILWAETIMLNAAIASTAIAGYSAYQQGKSAAAQAKSEAAWHAYNAKVAEREAEAERKASEIEAMQHKKAADKELARRRVLFGASGVTMAGSPLLLMEDTASELAFENAMIREQGLRRSGAYKSQSILDFSKSRTVSKSAKGYARAGLLSAGGSLLSGTSKVAYMRSKIK